MELGQTIQLTRRNGTRLLVRRLDGRDARALQAFNASLSTQSERWFRAHAYDDATVRQVLERSEAGDDLTLGAFAGPDLVAYFFLWYFRDPTPILGIGIRDAYQGAGLGHQLMRVLVEAATRANRDGIDLTTNLDNARAYALYEHCGFRYYRDVRNLQGDGSWVIEKAMFLPLKPGAIAPERQHRPPVG